MPIESESDDWTQAKSDDPLRAKIMDLLMKNKEFAYSVEEIEQHLLEEHHHLFPARLAGTDAVEGAKAARQSIITRILEDRFWHAHIRLCYVTEEQSADTGLYATWEGIGFSPIAELDEVTDPDPDSKRGLLEGRFKEIEENADEEISELEERISYIEYRLREDLLTTHQQRQ